MLKRIWRKLRGLGQSVAPDPVQAERFAAWFRDNGDRTHRLDYPLSSSSLVFDLGGYEGQWTADIYERYNCQVEVFEPFLPYAQKIKERFAGKESITVHEFGLAGSTRTEQLSSAGDASSAYRDNSNQKVAVRFKEATAFLDKQTIGTIDLMKINIEGGEYELLEHLIDTGRAGTIRNIQVQFHNFVPGAAERMAAIQQALSRTHDLTYQYLFVWENWTLKDGDR